MKYFDVFEIKDYHIKLLQKANLQWQNCEFGAPEIDPKRPYGNSSVYEDIADILNIYLPLEIEKDLVKREKVKMLLRRIHVETMKALQIFLSTKVMEPGCFGLIKEHGQEWIKLDPDTIEIKKLLKIKIPLVKNKK